MPKNTQTTQKQYNSQYDQELAEYNRKLAALNSQPVIAQNGSVKLVGSTGTPGSLKYYAGISAINTNTGVIALSNLGWNADTTLIGTTKKASYKDSTASHLTTGDINKFYDITDIIRNGGSITLTNVGNDQYGRKYDLHISFANTDGGAWGNTVTHASNAMVGPDYDGSIQFDYYGGFEMGTSNGNGINMKDMYFTLHGNSTPVNVFTNVLFSDLDGSNQEFDTNLGNLIAWTPSDSKIVMTSNSHFEATEGSLDGFNSSPNGTGVLLGQGNHFYYHFGAKGTPDQNWGNDVGVQFNLFGQDASVNSLIHPTRKTTQTNYHYDTSPIFFILSLWWLSMQAYIIAIAFTSYAVVLSIHA